MFDFFKNKKVLVTGHTGFKGSWLSYWLNLLGADVQGYALEPLSVPSHYSMLGLDNLVKSNIGDVRNRETLSQVFEDFKPEIVFHLAAQALVRKSYEEPINTFETNVMGSLNLLEQVRHTPSVRSLVYITSDKCYWNQEWCWGYREIDPLGGPDPYSASKACAEHVFKSYYLSYFKERESFSCGSTRAGNVIGGGDYSDDRIVPDIIRAVNEKQAIYLRKPNATRPWQHVLDPLFGYMTLAYRQYHEPEKFNGESWNFGPSNQSIKTVHELTVKILNPWPECQIKLDSVQNQPHESNLLHLSIDKAQSNLSWKPVYHFSKAVEVTSDWYLRVSRGEEPKEVTQSQISEFMKHVKA